MATAQYSDACEAYNRAVNLCPNDPQVWCSLGVLYYAFGQYREALGMLARALKLDPRMSDAWYNVGALYDMCDQPDDAQQAYLKAKEHGLADRFARAGMGMNPLAMQSLQYIGNNNNTQVNNGGGSGTGGGGGHVLPGGGGGGGNNAGMTNQGPLGAGSGGGSSNAVSMGGPPSGMNRAQPQHPSGGGMNMAMSVHHPGHGGHIPDPLQVMDEQQYHQLQLQQQQQQLQQQLQQQQQMQQHHMRGEGPPIRQDEDDHFRHVRYIDQGGGGGGVHPHDMDHIALGGPPVGHSRHHMGLGGGEPPTYMEQHPHHSIDPSNYMNPHLDLPSVTHHHPMEPGVGNSGGGYMESVSHHHMMGGGSLGVDTMSMPPYPGDASSSPYMSVHHMDPGYMNHPHHMEPVGDLPNQTELDVGYMTRHRMDASSYLGSHPLDPQQYMNMGDHHGLVDPSAYLTDHHLMDPSSGGYMGHMDAGSASLDLNHMVDPHNNN